MRKISSAILCVSVLASGTISAAAEEGDAEAQDRMEAMYRNGRGVAKDPERAVGWYRKAADQDRNEEVKERAQKKLKEMGAK